jgi:hypothetical protein
VLRTFTVCIHSGVFFVFAAMCELQNFIQVITEFVYS